MSYFKNFCNVVGLGCEAHPDSVDIDFGGIYEGNAYTTVTIGTETYSTCTGVVLGMVQDTLSSSGLPMCGFFSVSLAIMFCW